MEATAISEGTRVWLAELLEDGWTAEVVESRPIVHRYRLRLVDDLDDALLERVTPAKVGVRACRAAETLFVACRDAGEARSLLASAVSEADAA